ncbi:sigma-70 family RNA polymerase sigma factor [Seohaeicola saemankumensis]|nr:sigma-70 family RNA polymerase sigma factor [Seohaeicola saemankumensis]
MTPDQEMTEQTRWMLAVRDERDKRAFVALFDHFGPRLKAFVMRGGTGPELAEEVVQEVMLSVWRKAHQFDPTRAQVSGWIYQITRNCQIDKLRREKRPLPEMIEEEADSGPDAGDIVALEQESAHLKQALHRLNPEQREMIEKAYLGDLSHTEIRRITGLPLGTIKSRIRLGLERLRHELKSMREI